MYKRGDIVAVRFPFSDGSGAKLRPALVLSNGTIERTGDLILAMITASRRESDIVVELTTGRITDALPKKSFVRCHRLFAIEKSMILGSISSVTDDCMNEVLKVIVSIIS